MKTFSLILLSLALAAGVLLSAEQECYADEAKTEPACERSVCCPEQQITVQCVSACETEEQEPSLISRPIRCFGGAIGGFFSFGCKVNYQLTNWMLSDKCEASYASRGYDASLRDLDD